MKVIYNFHTSTRDSQILTIDIELIEETLDKPWTITFVAT